MLYSFTYFMIDAIMNEIIESKGPLTAKDAESIITGHLATRQSCLLHGSSRSGKTTLANSLEGVCYFSIQ